MYKLDKIIALAQTYFGIQKRKQEISEKEYRSLTEDEKRFYQRNLTKKGDYSLNQTEQRLKKDNIQIEKEACNTHNKIEKNC